MILIYIDNYDGNHMIAARSLKLIEACSTHNLQYLIGLHKHFDGGYTSYNFCNQYNLLSIIQCAREGVRQPSISDYSFHPQALGKGSINTKQQCARVDAPQ